MLDTSLFINLPPFRGLSVPEIEDISSYAKSNFLKKNTVVFHAGDCANRFFLLLDGHLRVVRTSPNGEQVLARYILAGELFGLAKALGMENYPADAICAVDCVVLSWPNSTWEKIVHQHPTFSTNAYKMIGTRLQDVQDRVVELSTERASQRVAKAILNLAIKSGKNTDSGLTLGVNVTRQNIAELTGTTLFTVSRLLSHWQREGIISSHERKISVVEKERLTDLALQYVD